MTAKKLLIYANDKTIGEALSKQLAALPDTALVRVENAHETALKEALDAFYDAVIVDEDNAFCLSLFKEGFTRPVFLICQKENEDTTNQDSLPFEIILKPFKVKIFLNKLYKALLKYENSNDKSFTIRNYLFIPLKRVLQDSSTLKEVPLTEKEAEILIYLHHAKGSIVNKEQLLRDIWGYASEVTTHTLETHIYRLRRKIEKTDNPIIISSDGGYRLA